MSKCGYCKKELDGKPHGGVVMAGGIVELCGDHDCYVETLKLRDQAGDRTTLGDLESRPTTPKN